MTERPNALLSATGIILFAASYVATWKHNIPLAALSLTLCFVVLKRWKVRS